jgi:hypothetical protein
MPTIPVNPIPRQKRVEINYEYAESVARVAKLRINKYHCPYAVLLYGLEYISHRISADHGPAYLAGLAVIPWYTLVGVYDESADIKDIAEDILATHQGDYHPPKRIGIRAYLAGRKSD